MSFQAYIDNITSKTGKTPEDFKKLAEQAGLLQPDMKASDLTDWLSAEFGLGHGHCMALWNVFISNGWVETKHTKLKKRV